MTLNEGGAPTTHHGRSRTRRRPRLLALGLALTAAACTANRPLLYPNAKLNEVGPTQARRDIEACKRIADGLVSSGQSTEIARDTVVGSGVGAAAGAAGGAIYGSAGTGAAAGAAGGAAGGLLSGLFRSTEPSPAYKNAVDACLAERGYRVIGWE